MPGVSDWKECPLKVVQSIFEQNDKSKFGEEVTSFFQKNLLDNPEILQWIPSLNSQPLHDMPSEGLVQFRLMVQDMFGPEYYHDEFEVKNTTTNTTKKYSGRYKDVSACDDDEEIISDRGVLSQRDVYYCIPIPGENKWVQRSYAANLKVTGSDSTPCSYGLNSTKRRRDSESEAAMDTDEVGTEVKRTHSGDDTVESDGNRTTATGIGASTGHSVTSTGHPVNVYNLPLGSQTDTQCKPALVKMYSSKHDEQPMGSNDIRVNDMLHVIGILSVDPTLSLIGDDDELMSGSESKVHHPPGSLVPRIHVIHYTKLQTNNPLLNTHTPTPNPDYQAINDIREELLSCLSLALGGDKLAAEYLLCHLVSTVHRRDASGVCSGKLSLNLTKIPQTTEDNSQSVSDLIFNLIERFTCSSHLLPMTTSNLNKLTFTPNKDYESNRLLTGLLQLPNRFHLLLDETQLEPGQLETTGVHNLTALGNLIKYQKVSYDFKYHQQDFHTDVSVLILSEARSLLPSDCLMPLVSDNDMPLSERLHALNFYLTAELKDKIRVYLSLVPTIKYEMSEDMSKAVQNDFVTTRQQDKESMSVEDFQSLLVLSRLVSISHGQTSLNKQVWDRVKEMEAQRKTRVTV